MGGQRLGSPASCSRSRSCERNSSSSFAEPTLRKHFSSGGGDTAAGSAPVPGTSEKLAAQGGTHNVPHDACPHHAAASPGGGWRHVRGRAASNGGYEDGLSHETRRS